MSLSRFTSTLLLENKFPLNISWRGFKSITYLYRFAQVLRKP